MRMEGGGELERQREMKSSVSRQTPPPFVPPFAQTESMRAHMQRWVSKIQIQIERTYAQKKQTHHNGQRAHAHAHTHRQIDNTHTLSHILAP